MNNYMKLEFLAVSENEQFARGAVCAFALALDPSVSVLDDIRTSVSEAVTNSIVHAYASKGGKVVIEAEIRERTLHIRITDFGRGIKDVARALQPFFTTLPSEERSGMGFTIMQTFMDELKVVSSEGFGTVVDMSKTILSEND